MSSSCSQCGANFSSDDTCQDRFNLSQFKELEQPAYYAVHHLSVACYLLQHNAYSRDGWLAVRELLFQFVSMGLTPAMARRQNQVRFDNGKRKQSLTKGIKLPDVEKIAWSCTIADVRLDSAELYCADVHHWAESILADSEGLIRTIEYLP